MGMVAEYTSGAPDNMGRLTLQAFKALLVPKLHSQATSRSALLVRFGLAILGPVITVGLSLLLHPIFEGNPYLLAWLGIAVATWYGGLTGGLTAAVLTLMLLEYFFYAPPNAIIIDAAFFVHAGVLALAVVAAGLARNGYLKTQHALRESEWRWATTLSSIGDAVIATDMAGHVSFMNKAAETLTSWSLEEALGQPVQEVFNIIGEAARTRVEDPVGRVLETGLVVGLANHTLLVRRDGTEIAIDDSGAPIKDEGGHTSGVVLVFRDITQRRQAEQALRVSEERFARAFHSSPAALSITRLSDGRFVDVNQSFVDLFGYSREELIGHSALELGMYDDVKERDELMRLQREQGSVRNYELTKRHKSGHLITVIIASDLIEFSGETYILSTRLDITERKQAEERLRQSEALFRRALEIESAGVIMFMVDGRITFANDAFLRMSGYSRADLEQGRMRWDKLTPPEWMPRSLRALEEFRTIGHTTPFEKEYLRKDGSRWWALFAATRITENEGVEFIIDITELKRFEQDRERLLAAETLARQEAEHANELRLRFLGMISHELRTPLTSIKGFATTLLADDVRWEPEQQRDFLQTIDEEADKLTDMIEQLLNLSRIESGTLRVEPTPQQLNAILESTRRQLDALTVDHTLQVAIPADLPPVQADAQRVGQVLTNLVGNAAKYSPAGTSITVEACRQDSVVKVSVSDQGTGIAPEDLPHVFEAFRRGGDNNARQTKGAGLGLAICKGIVEAHGGGIWIEPRTTPGTTVSFTLPLAS